MNFLVSGLTYGLIIVFTPLLIWFFYKLAKIFGVKEYSKEEIQQLTQKQYPNYYKTIYIVSCVWLFPAFFAAFFLVLVLLMSWLPQLSQTLFVDSQTLLFRLTSGWIQIIVFLYLLAAIGATITLVPACIVSLALKDFDAFCKVFEAKKKHNNISGKISKLKIKPTALLIMLLGFLLVAILLAGLYLNSYIKISNEKIIINNFTSIRGKSYNWSEIKFAKLYGTYNQRHNYSSGHFNFVMSDGAAILLWTSDNLKKGFIKISKDELNNIIEKIKSKNVKIQIQDEYLQYLENEEKKDKEIGEHIYERLTPLKN